MSAVRAEELAAQSLRDYLLRSLPAKVAALNALRAAVLRAPYAGPYVIPASQALLIGTVEGSETTTALIAGTRTATQIAAELAAVVGITASADSLGRLVLTATAAPSSSTPSVVSLGTHATANVIFGWPTGGAVVVRGALKAPGFNGVSDGDPQHYDLGEGFAVLILERRSVPRPNIRSDIHIVDLSLEIQAQEPSGNLSSGMEFIASVVRAVREVVLEDRTLDATVHLTELPSMQPSPSTFTFTVGGGSALITKARATLRIHVFERS